MKTKSLLIVSLVVLSILAAVYEGLAYWRNVEVASPVMVLWGFVFVLLLVLWVDADSKGRAEIYRPHEYGFLVFLWWVPYVPYYLWRTRGARGLLLLAGLVALYLLGWLAQLVLYIAADY
jgi:hypothetical protein